MGLDSSLESPREAHLAKASREGLDSLTSFQGVLQMQIPVGSVEHLPQHCVKPMGTGFSPAHF